MDNPFLKRATDFMRDEEAFIAIVSPEPVSYFLKKPGEAHLLYDRLVVMRGAPGSGKTTLGRLFAYPAITALLRNKNIEQYRSLVAALTQAGAIAGDKPSVLGCRLQLESDYREFWEFPYPHELKLQLMAALIQARSVLAWMRGLTDNGTDLHAIRIVPRSDAGAAIDAIGGAAGGDVVARAREVERALYAVVGALVAPPISDLDQACTSAYRPFDVIDRIQVDAPSQVHGGQLDLQPLVIMDDAHVLHPAQANALQAWLARRELRVARWVLTRLDVLHPHEMLAAITEDRVPELHLPGITATRDTTEIMLQSSGSNRRPQRLAFRAMARDMANRYLIHMPVFARGRLTRLSDMLSTEEASISEGKRRELAAHVSSAQRRLRVSPERRALIEASIRGFECNGQKLAEDVQLELVSVLMHRYSRRTAHQRSLFEESDGDPEPTRPLALDSDLVDAARIHLFHRYDRPFYFGIDDLCDASSENAEQFLRLAAALVDQLSAQIARGRRPSLDAAVQHSRLRQRASDVIGMWDFPHCRAVRRLVDKIAARCLAVSLEPNAPLGPGANAYGFPQDDIDLIAEQYPALARVLQFGIAYGAFSLVPRYPCKKRVWCLLELGGMAILHHGLTLKRGGFVEGSLSELAVTVESTIQ